MAQIIRVVIARTLPLFKLLLLVHQNFFILRLLRIIMSACPMSSVRGLVPQERSRTFPGDLDPFAF